MTKKQEHAAQFTNIYLMRFWDADTNWNSAHKETNAQLEKLQKMVHTNTTRQEYRQENEAYTKLQSNYEHVSDARSTCGYWAGFSACCFMLFELAKMQKLDETPIRYKKFKKAIEQINVPGVKFFSYSYEYDTKIEAHAIPENNEIYGNHYKLYSCDYWNYCAHKTFGSDYIFSSTQAAEAANKMLEKIPTIEQVNNSLYSIDKVRQSYNEKSKEIDAWEKEQRELIKYAHCARTNLKTFHLV